MNYIQPVKTFLISSAVAMAAFVYFFFSETGLLPNFKNYPGIILWSVFAYNIIGFALHSISHWLNIALPYFSGISKRLFVGFFINIFSGSALYLLFAWVFFFFHEDTLFTFLDKHPDLSLKHLIVSILTILFYTLIDFTLFSFKYYTAGQIAHEKRKREKLHLQFEALRNQLSPHFLFNSLNTISSLIYKDGELAEKYIRKLAHTYDYILKTLEKNLVTVKEELQIVDAYKFLMEVRYQRAFALSINIDEKYNSYMLPPLSIQMLVENAIKHNVISDSEPLKVSIMNDMNHYLIIKNNITASPVKGEKQQDSFKIGLENIKQRYAFFTAKKMKVEKQENFMVKIPIIYPQTDEK